MSRRRDTQLSRPHRGHKFVRESSRSLERGPPHRVTGGMGLATGACASPCYSSDVAGPGIAADASIAQEQSCTRSQQ